MSHDEDSNECRVSWFGNRGDCLAVSGHGVGTYNWYHVGIAKYDTNIKFYINGAYKD